MFILNPTAKTGIKENEQVLADEAFTELRK